jgi:hypothetical protein
LANFEGFYRFLEGTFFLKILCFENSRKFCQNLPLLLKKCTKFAGFSYCLWLNSYEITKLFNERFALRGREKCTWENISTLMFRHGLKTGRNMRFGFGQISSNKGKKGITLTAIKKWRESGGKFPNERAIGTEAINHNGHVRIKTSNAWKLKHHIIWEEAHGPIPEGHVVIFADGNKQNFALDNLLSVSRAELWTMSRLGLIFTDKEMTKTAKSIADLTMLINDRKRNPGLRRIRKKKEREASPAPSGALEL